MVKVAADGQLFWDFDELDFRGAMDVVSGDIRRLSVIRDSFHAIEDLDLVHSYNRRINALKQVYGYLYILNLGGSLWLK